MGALRGIFGDCIKYTRLQPTVNRSVLNIRMICTNVFRSLPSKSLGPEEGEGNNSKLGAGEGDVEVPYSEVCSLSAVIA